MIKIEHNGRTYEIARLNAFAEEHIAEAVSPR